jgi:hypothetical protein
MIDVVDVQSEIDTHILTETTDAAPVSAAERARFDEYNRARSLRLSALVALGFGGFTLVALLGVGLYASREPGAVTPRLLLMAGTLVVCVALYAVGFHMARQRQVLLAAATITGSMLLSISMFQVIWASARGADALLVATFGVDAIGIGLADVLGNAGFMFAYTTVIDAVAGVTMLVIPTATRLPAPCAWRMP